jgi:hypothetical protein
MYSPQVAQRFLEQYKQVVGPGFVHHPYWDIDALLDRLPDPGYYPPWQDFGLGPIEEEVLYARQDEHLRLILSRIE